MKTKRSLIWIWLMVLVLALGVGGAVMASQPGEPLPGTVQGLRGPNVFWNGTVIAGSTVTYTSAPKTVYGTDVSLTWLYHSADIFVTADITPSSYLTITPQYSVDQSNWVNATYVSEGWVLPLSSSTTLTNSSGVTSTTTSTSTTTFSGATASRSSEEVTYQITMSADGSDYLRIPLAGKYLRFKIEHSAAVTPTISVMLRND
jgi:hypothetical protein